MALIPHTLRMSDETQDVTERAIRAAIRARRAAIGVANAELARKAGISLSTFNHYVQGDRKLYFGTLVQIAGALDTTVESLVRDATELMRQGLVPADATDPPGRG